MKCCLARKTSAHYGSMEVDETISSTVMSYKLCSSDVFLDSAAEVCTEGYALLFKNSSHLSRVQYNSHRCIETHAVYVTNRHPKLDEREKEEGHKPFHLDRRDNYVLQGDEWMWSCTASNSQWCNKKRELLHWQTEKSYKFKITSPNVEKLESNYGKTRCVSHCFLVWPEKRYKWSHNTRTHTNIQSFS